MAPSATTHKVSVMEALSRAGVAPWTVWASVAGHLLFGVGIIVTQGLFGDRTQASMVPEHTMVMLSPGVLPQQQTILPERPTRTADAPEVTKAAPDAPPPPPKKSELALPEKPPEPEKGQEKEEPVNRSRDRAALIRKTQKQALVKDPNAALGAKDQHRTSPDGATSGRIGQALDASNPEIRAWWTSVEPVILDKWVIVEADRRSHAGKKVVVWMRILPDGTLRDAKVQQKSGVHTVDRAALMAVLKTGRVTPPPASLQRDFQEAGFTMGFVVDAK